jgi:hypothetical protein
MERPEPLRWSHSSLYPPKSLTQGRRTPPLAFPCCGELALVFGYKQLWQRLPLMMLLFFSPSPHHRYPLPGIYLSLHLFCLRTAGGRRHHLASLEPVADEAEASELHSPRQDHPPARRDHRVRPAASPTTCSHPRWAPGHLLWPLGFLRGGTHRGEDDGCTPSTAF